MTDCNVVSDVTGRVFTSADATRLRLFALTELPIFLKCLRFSHSVAFSKDLEQANVRENLQLSTEEMKTLIISGSQIESCILCAPMLQQLVAALEMTLAEGSSKNVWTSPVAQIFGLVCLFSESPVENMIRIVGAILKPDRRKLSSLASRVKNDERSIPALCAACSHVATGLC